MELEVRHLRVVCAIAEHGSLTRAAAALYLTQPALTSQLRRIERILGGTLFVREVTGSTPTPLGRLVLDRARALLPAFDELHQEATRFGRSMAGVNRVRFGASPSPMLTGLIHRLRNLLPGTDISVRTSGSTLALGEMLAADSLEAAAMMDPVGMDTPMPSGVERHEIAVESVCVRLAARHPAVARGVVELAELANEDWIINPPENDTAERHFRITCARHGFVPRITHILDATAPTSLDLIRDGLAVILCQPSTTEIPGVATLPIAGNPIQSRHLIAWHRETPFANHIPAVIDLAKAAYAERRAPTASGR